MAALSRSLRPRSGSCVCQAKGVFRSLRARHSCQPGSENVCPRLPPVFARSAVTHPAPAVRAGRAVRGDSLGRETWASTGREKHGKPGQA